MNILITGAGSYVGTQVENWLKKDGQFRIDAVDTFGDNWKKADYTQYEVVYHVAGIAHVNADPKMEALGAMADKLAEELQKKDFITLTAAEVMDLLEQIVMPVDAVVLERLQLNRERYLAELRTFLVQ